MKKILLIEDDMVVRENTAELIELSGYEVITAPNGKIGVTVAKNELPDLIVCDIMMPELDGYGVLDALASDEATKHIPFIFLSAKSDHKDIRKGMNMGADDYLTKPFEEKELMSAIESRLAKSDILKEMAAQKQVDEQMHSLNDLKNHIDDNGTIREFRKGETVFAQGNNSNYIYLLTKGVAKSHRIDENGKELITRIFKEDDLIGYSSCIQNIPYQESVTAIENSRFASISKEELKNILTKNHKVALDIVELLSDSLSETKEQLLQMAYGSVRKRTAATILQFAEKINRKPAESIKISRADLANVAGIATESLIRTLSNFNKEGIIEIDGRSIKILDLEKLKEME